MTLLTTLACFLAGAHRVAFPATLVNHYLGAERFIRDIRRIGAMAFRTYVRFALDVFRFVMANTAFDRGGIKVVRMRRIQFLGIDLMVTINTLDAEILDVHLMVKHHLAYRRRKGSFRRDRNGVCAGS